MGEGEKEQHTVNIIFVVELLLHYLPLSKAWAASAVPCLLITLGRGKFLSSRLCCVCQEVKNMPCFYFRLCFTVTNQDQTVHQMAARNTSHCNSTESLIKHAKMHIFKNAHWCAAWIGACFCFCSSWKNLLDCLHYGNRGTADNFYRCLTTIWLNTRVQNGRWANNKKCFAKFCSGLAGVEISRLDHWSNCTHCQILIIFRCNWFGKYKCIFIFSVFANIVMT